MPGIPGEVIEHHLKIYPNAKPVSQKPRRQSVERHDFIREEVRKLLHTGFIEEVHHPVWLTNPVIVPKANGKLRMCIDYTSLNKACPKDPYPLPRIDQIVDSTSGCNFLSFLDAYSGFHQIRMSREDRKHTAFVTVDGLYCYVVMPYGLKNALPTFVRAMSKTFGDLIRDKVEVYVDDIVVKTRRGSTVVEDLTLVFDKLRATRTKLNPEKCIFGVFAGKLLGFLVSYRGIEANPEKIKAIKIMRPPALVKDIQKLTGSLAALSRFISRLAERALPFFKLLRKSGPFAWTGEAEQAFRELKQHLTSLPILVAPDPGETMYLYIAAAAEAVSMVLVAERATPEGQRPENSEPASGARTVQKPVYYVSEVLHEAKVRYLETHKLLYAVLVTSRKLRHYFQAQRVVVVTSFPLRAILHNSNATGNITKWAAELAEFQPCHAIKSQVLADFIVEWTPPPYAPGGPDPEPGPTPAGRGGPVFTEPHWTLFFDGSAHQESAGAGVVLVSPDGDQLKYVVCLEFKATNNMAEYEALIFSLSTALSLGVRQLLVKGDSQLIIKQTRAECSCNEPRLAAYLLHVKKLEKDFAALELQHVPRANNSTTDDLSQRASTRAPAPEGAFKRRLLRPTARPAKLSEGGRDRHLEADGPGGVPGPTKGGVCTGGIHQPLAPQPTTQSGPDAWISEIRDYLKENILPQDHVSAERIVRLAKRYTTVDGDLYHHGANGILMRCITQEEGRELLTEIHGGECRSHSSSHTLVGKAFQHGFYWPTALQDAAELVKSCKACQYHAKLIHTPTQALQMILPSWSFAVWGVDILGPFPRAIGGYRYLFVAIDKFTKWPEATPVVNIT
jgi:ribonuclease HI